MPSIKMLDNANPEELYSYAEWLAIFTIVYNIIEGLVSLWFGVADETLSLFAFGLDSFVEVISAIGIWHMVRRQKQTQEQADRDSFERMALKITGTAFYLLTAGLTFTACWNVYQGHKPETMLWGIIIGVISTLFMWLLVNAKTTLGRRMHSDALLSDAACSKVCMYLSLVLLLSSALYALTGIAMLDAAGSLVIAWFAFQEGKEAFEKAEGRECTCHGSCSSSKCSD